MDLSSQEVQETVNRLTENQIFICPTFLSARRRANFDEVINDPYLDYMVPIMPYHRHLKNMRNPFGYVIGKRYLNQYMNIPNLDKKQQKELEEGIQLLREMLYLLYEKGVQLVVGSDSPPQGVVPGFSLYQEMKQWAMCKIPVREILRAATCNASRLLKEEEIGQIHEGSWADLICLDQDPEQNLDAIFNRDKKVLCRGRRVV